MGMFRCCQSGCCHFFTQIYISYTDFVYKKIAGCTGGLGRGNILSNGIGSGGGYGGKGGKACSNDFCVEGGISYGTPDLPCELGSGSGSGNSTGTTAGGGIIGKRMFCSAKPFLFTNVYYIIDFFFKHCIIDANYRCFLNFLVLYQ
jgi:hypothetical protein